MKFSEKKIDTTSKNNTLLEFNFFKPWWLVYTKQKKDIIIVLVASVLSNILITLFPALISWAIQTESFRNLIIVICLFLLDEFVGWSLLGPAFMNIFIRTAESFRYSAYQHILTVDPLYHAQHSSGISLGKIRRTMEAYKDITKIMLDDFIPLIISLTTMVILFCYSDVALAFMTSTGLLLLTIIFCIVATYITQPLEQQANQDDDRANHIGTESITQARFIRATFASNQTLERLRTSHKKVSSSLLNFFNTYRFMRGVFISMYMICIGLLTGYLIYLMHQKLIIASTALALVVTILNSTYPLLKMDKKLRETLSAYRKIKDFYQFMRSFGKQSYPVYSAQLPDKKPVIIHPKDPITLDVNFTTVIFPNHKPFFSDLSMHISVHQSDPNKLYGIIGPSGIGKTTLLFLIGGQLKPDRGSVMINGYDLYALSDRERQLLLALQGQSAINLYETLHYNLTFGLPYDHGYSNEELIELLDAVGLWSLFKDKQGLQTLIGEGGASLSGGQRQRLNFVNLYLRAKLYKPPVILIDEPTSSLDELSEHKVTEMINQLAHTSLTLVIAHRLKTLDNAAKITDFCMLAEHNELNFYTHDELYKKSYYYQQLVSGETKMGDGE